MHTRASRGSPISCSFLWMPIMLSFLLIVAFSLPPLHLAVAQPDSGAVSVVYNAGDDDGSADQPAEATRDDGLVSSEDDDITYDQHETFQATEKWQTVKPGQHIPAGLHVRMNLQTGEREAKLLDPSRKVDTVSIADKPYSFQEIKETLKNIKDEAPIVEPDDQPEKKFRSYDELKKELSFMNTAIQTDLEILRELIAEFKVTADQDRRCEILAELEYHVHQIDNGMHFVDMGGLAMILPLFNSTNDCDELRKHAAHLVGSAAHSNPKVQIAMVDSGLLAHFVSALPLEANLEVRKKYLFAVGSIVRHFPYAQKKLLDLGGVETLVAVLRDRNFSGEAATTTAADKIRVLALIHDLLAERVHSDEEEESIEKRKQYEDVPIKNALVDAGICYQLPRALRDLSTFDGKQKVIELLSHIGDDCLDAVDRARSHLTQIRTELSDKIETTAAESDELDSREFNELVRSLVDSLDNLLSASRRARIEL